MDSRPGGDEADDLTFVVEYFVRPLVRVFRTALDSYGLVFADPLGPDTAFELRADLAATGRVLVMDSLSVSGAAGLMTRRAATLRAARESDTDLGALTAWSSRNAATTVTTTLHALAEAFSRARPDSGEDPGSAFREVLAAEMRYLRSDTARLLSADAGWAAWAHSVPEQQERALARLLARLQDRARECRVRPDKPLPVVLIGPLTDACARALPGLPQLCRDVWHAGGETVFLAEPGRPAPRYAADLARYGVPDPTVLIPRSADGAGPAAAAAALARWDRRAEVVACLAVLDPTVRAPVGWESFARQFPGAALLVVGHDEGTGTGTGTRAGTGSGDVPVPSSPPPQVPGGPEVVKALERQSPAATQVSTPPAPTLPTARSLSSLRLDALRYNPAIEQHAVRWSGEETRLFVDHLVAAARRNADRTARAARDTLGRRLSRSPTDAERTVRLVHHILQRKQFKHGPSSHYPPELALREMLPFVRRGAPVPMAMVFFPNKFAHSKLKAVGDLPDLAELAMLVRLLELMEAVHQVYSPGLFFFLAADNQHYRAHPPAKLEEGMLTMSRYAGAAGLSGEVVEIVAYDELAERHQGTAFVTAHRALRARILAEYRAALRGLDITSGPLRALREADVRDPRGNFTDLFRSLVFSVRTSGTVPAAGSWWSEVYADLYNLAKDCAAPEVIAARKEVLTTAWDDALRYVATWHADARTGYRSKLVPGGVQASLRPMPGRIGLNLLGGTALSSAHATGAIDARGVVSREFAVALRDQCFVPVYSPLLGPGQPFAMVPVTATQARGDGAGARIDPAFLRTTRLRRR
ncbi:MULTISPECIES: L-tyrosine/L-tryptophan isonitrile synthase family protein [unclassified Streptomyces]|uniref:L-tyrosine/L-tryptophan isonitrile synthase family protein n=1 Tax=unclassified Streptomyces TaxID=2593676 RepID=UPI00336A99A8